MCNIWLPFELLKALKFTETMGPETFVTTSAQEYNGEVATIHRLPADVQMGVMQCNVGTSPVPLHMVVHTINTCTTN